MNTLSISTLSHRLTLQEGNDTHRVPHCFVDVDEVVADFRGACHRLYGTSTHKEIENVLNAPGAWDDPKIFGIFGELDLMPDAKQLMSGLFKLREANRIRVSMLTALPMPWLKSHNKARGDQARRDKKAWIARHFPSVKTVITCARSHKGYYGLADTVATGLQAILIDDNKSNIKDWKNIANGFGILHTSARTSLAQLHAHLDK
jgi:hypothetical protein